MNEWLVSESRRVTLQVSKEFENIEYLQEWQEILEEKSIYLLIHLANILWAFTMDWHIPRWMDSADGTYLLPRFVRDLLKIVCNFP